MSGLKDKAIKWLGGFTKEEAEILRTKNLLQKPCFVRDQLNTVRLSSELWLWEYEKVREDQLLSVLAEGLANQTKDHISIEVISDGEKRFYRGEIEVVVREGAE